MQGTCIRLTLHPHQDGAKGLRAEYGARSVWVRYRYDAQKQKRYKTVELCGSRRKVDAPRSTACPGPDRCGARLSSRGKHPSAGQKCRRAVGCSTVRVEVEI
jgi:hypothetical protein